MCSTEHLERHVRSEAEGERMRRKSPLVRRSAESDINNAMTPMIDVVFLLLVFFVWTASFQLVEYVMPPSEMSSQMGSESTEVDDEPPPKDFENIVVRIRWSAQQQQPIWTLDNQTVDSVDTVADRLNKLAEIFAGDAPDDVTVILHPDPEVPLGFVIDTYDAALASGFPKLSFAVNRKK